MTKEEIREHFNALPFDERITIGAFCYQDEIDFCEREKRRAKEAHRKNIARLNERINFLIKKIATL